MLRTRQLLAVTLMAATLPLGGCLFRTHKVEQPLSPAEVKTATRDELVQRINEEAAKIQTLNATVDISTAVGGAKKGKVTEYQEIRGYVLVREPNELRMIGLLPLVRSTAFDMVSDGQSFRLSVPPTGKFYVGRNDVIHPVANQPLANLRPQHIFDALLLRQIDPQNEIAVLESTSETLVDSKTKKPVVQPDYSLIVLRRDGPNDWFLSRKIIFNRVDLLPHEQIVYDKLGNVATDAKYGQFKGYNGVSFPSVIMIHRPQEEYTITLSVVKITINSPLKPEQFVLNQPTGATVVNLDNPQQAESGGKPSSSPPQ